jgi:lipoprotein-anchoring transpeptidase ErfK/SrfK
MCRNLVIFGAFHRANAKASEMRTPFLAFISAALVVTALTPALGASRKAAQDKSLSFEAINSAEWRGKSAGAPQIVKLQVLLDRAHASPGQIDGTQSQNTRKAVAAFREMHGLGRGDRVDEQLWRALNEADSEPATVPYTITKKDTAGPFIDKVPKDYREKASLKRLAYTSTQELLAEKFHMSEKLLRRLNPNADFDQADTAIVVANVQRETLPRKIARVEVDAAGKRVLAYDKEDRIVAVYPATVGSSERPSPSGEFKVKAVAENPTYNYDPALNLRGVDVDEKLQLPPGPNNPVGLVWIALSAKGYGIHGTPDPEDVGKRASHGCVRLTNWDALELARHVGNGTPVTIGAQSGKARQAANN